MFWNIFVVLLREKSWNLAFYVSSLVYYYKKRRLLDLFFRQRLIFKILIVRIIFTCTPNSVAASSYNVTMTLNILRKNLRTWRHTYSCIQYTWPWIRIYLQHKYFSNTYIKYDKTCPHSIKCLQTNQSFNKLKRSHHLINTFMNIRTVYSS